MQSLNKNGVSITQTPGEEKFVKCHLVHIPEHTRSLSGSLLGYKTIP